MGTINSRGGKLFLDFRYRGVRCREYTKLEDKPANRKRASTLMERIDAEILLGTFSYAVYFPNSKRVAHFESHTQRLDRIDADVPVFRDFAEQWFTECQVGWKHSYKITLRTSLDKHILPTFGTSHVTAIKKAEVLAFRTNLATIPRKNGDQGLSPARINHIMVPLRMILNEAAERYEFDSPCFESMSLRQLSTESGISMGGLYSYIGSKEELANLIEHVLSVISTELTDRALENVEGIKNKLAAAISAHIFLSEQLQPWFYFVFMESKSLSKSQKEKAKNTELNYELRISNLIKQGIDAGLFQPVDAELTAAATLALLQDWHLKKWKHRKRKISVDQYTNFVVNLIFAQLEK